MIDNFEKAAEQAATYQKLWMDTAGKMFQAAFTVTPNSPPPEVLRQMRSGIFQALAKSWDEFMRSPEFMDGMRQWMENAVNFRKMTNELMARARNEMQAPSRDDIDTVLLNIRHMEKRLLDRVDELEKRVGQVSQRLRDQGRAKRSGPKAATVRPGKSLRPKA
jgi:hypothetical protein